jgi:O-antigen/teichoic acid export membrane protein
MLRSIFSNWFGLVVMGVTSVILTPILIHGLGDFYYGLWILVASALDYYGVLDLGMRPALFRAVAWSKGANDRAAMHETLLSALAFTVAVGLFVLVLTLLLVPILPGFFKLAGPARRLFPWLVILLGLNVAVAFPARMLGAYLNSLGRFDLYNLAAILSTIPRAVFVIVALRLGHGIRAVAGITLVATIFSLLLHWALVRRVDRELALDWRLARWSRLRQLFRFGSLCVIYAAGDNLRFYTDSIVIARILGAALITPFNVAARLMEYFKQLMIGIGGPLTGRMSELDGQARHEDLREYFLRATRISALLAVFIASILVFDGRLLLRLWVGERFLSSYPLLLTLTAGYLVAFAQQSCVIAISARDRLRPIALWNVAEGIVNLLLSIYWAKKYGLIGIALGTAVPMLVVNVLVGPIYALRAVGLPVRDYLRRAMAQPAAVGLLFAGVCRFTPASPDDGTFLYLLWTLAWQTALFSLLAYTLGLRSFERRTLFEHGKQLAATLRLVRASSL